MQQSVEAEPNVCICIPASQSMAQRLHKTGWENVKTRKDQDVWVRVLPRNDCINRYYYQKRETA